MQCAEECRETPCVVQVSSALGRLRWLALCFFPLERTVPAFFQDSATARCETSRTMFCNFELPPPSLTFHVFVIIGPEARRPRRRCASSSKQDWSKRLHMRMHQNDRQVGRRVGQRAASWAGGRRQGGRADGGRARAGRRAAGWWSARRAGGRRRVGDEVGRWLGRAVGRSDICIGLRNTSSWTIFAMVEHNHSQMPSQPTFPSK